MRSRKIVRPKTVQYALKLAKSDAEMYETRRPRQAPSAGIAKQVSGNLSKTAMCAQVYEILSSPMRRHSLTVGNCKLVSWEAFAHHILKTGDRMREARLATYEQLSFAIFCIEAVAEYLNKDPRDVYALLADKKNLLDDYVARYYDALHTQDKLYIAEDIVRELVAEGALT